MLRLWVHGHLFACITACFLLAARGSGQAKCVMHQDCKAEEFCMLENISAWERTFDYISGRCRPCNMCDCHVYAIDAMCPKHCPSPKLEMQFLQGTFLNRDVNGDGSTCLKIFRFEGISFRQHDTGMSHKEAYRSSFFSNPTEPVAAERKMIPVPPMNSTQTCKSSLRAGLFKTAAASFGFMRKSSFKLELKIPIYDTDPHANKENLRQDISLEGGTYSYEDETIDCHRECPGAIKCKFLDGSVEVFQKGEISTIFSAEEERPRYAELLDGHQYTGNISIFDTTCTISMDFTPLNARNLVYFTAATTECKIGSMFAPEMPGEPTQKYPSESCQLPTDCGPWWAVQNIDKLRHDSLFPPPRPDSVTFRRQHGNCGKCGSETICINTTLQYPTVSGVIFNFTCACNHGFVFQSTTHTDRMDCVDFDECTEQTHECHQLATCVNTYGSYTCTCMAGAEGNGPKDNPQCACKRGFILSGSSCSDLQECVEKAHNCHRHAACTNTYGSFYCACNKGFVNAGINSSQVANASQVANSTQVMGLSCIPASKVWIERVWPVGNGLGWDITWSIENAPNVMDVISVFKIDNVVIAWDAQGSSTFGEVPSLLYWVYPSATVNTNSLAASCTQIPSNCFTVTCYLPCHTPGSPDNQEWRKGSLQFKSTSLGMGKYRAVLFSMDLKEVTAIYDYDIEIENVGDARTMGGGVQGCNGLYIGSRCCQNTTMCVVLPDRLDPYNRPQDKRLPKRCGDGRLELYAPPQDIPMTTDQERDGRIEECDDGKNDDGDGCDANCRIEPNTNCNYYNSPFSLQKDEKRSNGSLVIYQLSVFYSPQSKLISAESDCTRRFCGDGFRNVPGEDCDDGNNIATDGCHNCKVSFGWICKREDCTQKEKYGFCVEQCIPYVLVVSGHPKSTVPAMWVNRSLQNQQCPSCGGPESECVYFRDKYMCRCKQGYSKDIDYKTGKVDNTPGFDLKCTDIDECRFEGSPANVMAVNSQLLQMFTYSDWTITMCHKTGVCTNKTGSVNCTCPSGVSGTGYFLDPPCEDINECRVRPGAPEPCANNAVCRNIVGAYICECKEGYRGNPWPSLAGDAGCVNMDECAEGTHSCHATSKCANTDGGFDCVCSYTAVKTNFYRGACYPDDFFRNNKALFNRMGWYGPTMTQGLVRLMDAPFFSNFASVGLGWWLFLEQDGLVSFPGSLQAHKMLYSLAGVAPIGGAQGEDWGPIQCDPVLKSSITDQNGTMYLYGHNYLKDRRHSIVVNPPRIPASRVFHIKWHFISLIPGETLKICSMDLFFRNLCETFDHTNVEELIMKGTHLPEEKWTKQIHPSGSFWIELELQTPLKDFDAQECVDFPSESQACLQITKDHVRTNAREGCVNSTLLNACCSCGGGSKGYANVLFKLENSYAHRRYKFVFSYFLEDDNTRKDMDMYFANEGQKFKQEIALGNKGDRPMKHTFQISNNDNNVDFPKCLSKKQITDPFSTISLERNPQRKTFFDGTSWKGTCIPTRDGSGNRRCNVHLFVRGSMFEWRIENCYSFAVDRLMVGTLHSASEVTRNSLGGLHSQRFHIFLTTDTKKVINPEKVFAITVAWKGSLDTVEPADRIELAVNFPEYLYTFGYPAEINATFLPQYVPCGVSTLFRVTESDFAIPQPQPWSIQKMEEQNLPLTLYLMCNQSIADMMETLNILYYNTDSIIATKQGTCSSVLAGLVGTRIPLDGLSERQMLTIEGACSHDCFLDFNASFYSAVEKCTDARIHFQNTMRDWKVRGFKTEELKELDETFKARLVFLAETRTRVELTCTTNYLKKSCRRIVGMLTSSKCIQMPLANSSFSIGSTSSIAFDLVRSSVSILDELNKPIRQCTPDCKQSLSFLKREAHCCAASFYEVQSLWMDLVAPGLQTFDLDLRTYRCIYEENFDCAKAPSEPLSLRRQWPPSTNLVKYPIRVELDEKCTSFLPQPMLPKDVSLTAKDQSLKCAFSACGTVVRGLEVVQELPWPQPCCMGLKARCQNGGTVSFDGACFCMCPAPYVGQLCTKPALHLAASLFLKDVEFSSFVTKDFAESIALSAGVSESMAEVVEVAWVDVISSTKRSNSAWDEGTTNVSADQEDTSARLTNGRERDQRSQRRFGAGLDVGFRILLQNERQGERTQTLLDSLIANGRLEIFGAKVTFSNDPCIVSANGNSCKSKIKYVPEANVTVAGKDTTEENKLNLIVLLVALIGVVVFVACCGLLWCCLKNPRVRKVFRFGKLPSSNKEKKEKKSNLKTNIDERLFSNEFDALRPPHKAQREHVTFTPRIFAARRLKNEDFQVKIVTSSEVDESRHDIEISSNTHFKNVFRRPSPASGSDMPSPAKSADLDKSQEFEKVHKRLKDQLEKLLAKRAISSGGAGGLQDGHSSNVSVNSSAHFKIDVQMPTLRESAREQIPRPKSIARSISSSPRPQDRHSSISVSDSLQLRITDPQLQRVSRLNKFLLYKLRSQNPADDHESWGSLQENPDPHYDYRSVTDVSISEQMPTPREIAREQMPMPRNIARDLRTTMSKNMDGKNLMPSQNPDLNKKTRLESGMAEEGNFNQSKFESLSPYLSPVQMVPGGRNSPALSAEVGYHKPHLVLSYDATRRQSIKDSSVSSWSAGSVVSSADILLGAPIGFAQPSSLWDPSRPSNLEISDVNLEISETSGLFPGSQAHYPSSAAHAMDIHSKSLWLERAHAPRVGWVENRKVESETHTLSLAAQNMDIHSQSQWPEESYSSITRWPSGEV